MTPQVYVGVCPEDVALSTHGLAELKMNGVPHQCVAWKAYETSIVVCDGGSDPAHDSMLTTYAIPKTVYVYVCNGRVNFYESAAGVSTAAPRLVASVPSKLATLRPFVSVRGNQHSCTVVPPPDLSVFGHKSSLDNTVLSGMSWLFTCMHASMCVYNPAGCKHTPFGVVVCSHRPCVLCQRLHICLVRDLSAHRCICERKASCGENMYMHTCVYIYIYIYIPAHTTTCTYMYVCLRRLYLVCVYNYVYVCMLLYAHVYVYLSFRYMCVCKLVNEHVGYTVDGYSEWYVYYPAGCKHTPFGVVVC